ncbi:hypothetical protein X798_02163 [Onchocerca flexuosa]|uniref:Uncharacterized protein n=1 Tax=Onchocerca flexuosa TaxID=387005 RepID=A0A238BZQ4_9BILA|nr:hypothetical protein X798_02163 [Onchocerca flexuosa]
MAWSSLQCSCCGSRSHLDGIKAYVEVPIDATACRQNFNGTKIPLKQKSDSELSARAVCYFGMKIIT